MGLFFWPNTLGGVERLSDDHGLREAILSAYTLESLRAMLAERLSVKFEHIASSASTFKDQVRQVVDHFERQGPSEMARFVIEASNENPGNAALGKYREALIRKAISANGVFGPIPSHTAGDDVVNLDLWTRLISVEHDTAAIRKDVEGLTKSLGEVKSDAEARGQKTADTLQQIKSTIDTDVSRNSKDIASIFEILAELGHRAGLNISPSAIQSNFLRAFIWVAVLILVFSGLIITVEWVSAFFS